MNSLFAIVAGACIVSAGVAFLMAWGACVISAMTEDAEMESER